MRSSLMCCILGKQYALSFPAEQCKSLSMRSSLHKPLWSSTNVLHFHCRQSSSSASSKAIASPADAIQTLSEFEAGELSGRFKGQDWLPLRHITSLKKMQLTDALRMMKSYGWQIRDVFVPGKLSAKAIKSGTTGLSTITGSDGSDCILVVLNCAVPRLERISLLLPEGANVAVKEPLLAMTLGGSTPVVVAPCPAALEFFDLTAEEPEQEADVLLEQGNRLYSEGQYILAAQKYGSVLSKASVTSDDYVVAASSRAACLVELKRFDDAIVDCERALGVNPKHAKSFEMKAAAFGGLGEYKQALKCLEQAGRSEGTESMRTRYTRLLRQTEKQSYDLDHYYMSGCNVNEAPECSDFVGPVETRMTKDGRGRGLFLTKDVVPGQLLMVSNAIVYVSNNEDRFLTASELQSCLEAEALRVCSGSSKSLRQLMAMADMNKAPDMALFQTRMGTPTTTSSAPIDVAQVIRVLRWLHFGLVQSEVAPLHRGAWGLPALINHSCLPNVAIDNVGQALFMRASRPLRAGQELFLSYMEALEPWCIRINSSWQFSCKCQRCILEKRHDSVLREILEQDPKQGPDEEYNKWISRMARFCIKLEGVMQKLKLSKIEADWIRASASNEYANCLQDEEIVNNIRAACPKFPSLVEMMKIIHQTAPGQFKTSRMICELMGHCVDAETTAVCLDELSARYGWEIYLKQNVVTGLVSWLKSPESLRSAVRVK